MARMSSNSDDTLGTHRVSGSGSGSGSGDGGGNGSGAAIRAKAPGAATQGGAAPSSEWCENENEKVADVERNKSLRKGKGFTRSQNTRARTARGFRIVFDKLAAAPPAVAKQAAGWAPPSICLSAPDKALILAGAFAADNMVG